MVLRRPFRHLREFLLQGLPERNPTPYQLLSWLLSWFETRKPLFVKELAACATQAFKRLSNHLSPKLAFANSSSTH